MSVWTSLVDLEPDITTEPQIKHSKQVYTQPGAHLN